MNLNIQKLKNLNRVAFTFRQILNINGVKILQRKDRHHSTFKNALDKVQKCKINKKQDWLKPIK